MRLSFRCWYNVSGRSSSWQNMLSETTHICEEEGEFDWNLDLERNGCVYSTADCEDRQTNYHWKLSLPIIQVLIEVGEIFKFVEFEAHVAKKKEMWCLRA